MFIHFAANVVVVVVSFAVAVIQSSPRFRFGFGSVRSDQSVCVQEIELMLMALWQALALSGRMCMVVLRPQGGMAVETFVGVYATLLAFIRQLLCAYCSAKTLSFECSLPLTVI